MDIKGLGLPATYRFLPRCIAREDIHCDIDDNLVWSEAGTSGGIERLHCKSSYSSLGQFCLKTVSYDYISDFVFFPLCYGVL